MGILDHRKTWRFELKATPKSCTDSFVVAMTQSKGALSLRRADWKVRRESDPASSALLVAHYTGRKGIAAGITPLSEQATITHEVAKGSEISFRVDENGPRTGQVACSMWLSSYGTRLVFFIADAPIFRSYMAEVARALRSLDPAVRLEKA